MTDFLDTDITYLKGVGPKRADLLFEELGIRTFRDLIYNFPFKYIDRSKFYSIRELSATNTFVQIRGRITSFKTEGSKYKKRLTALFNDGNSSIELVWFQGASWALKNLQAGVDYIIFGKPALFNRKLSIAHPEIELAAKFQQRGQNNFEPHYNTSEKLKRSYLNSKAIMELVRNLIDLEQFDISETLPAHIIEANRLIGLQEALRIVHFPSNNNELKLAEHRLKFDELFYIQLSILGIKSNRTRKYKGFIFKEVGDSFNNFYKKNLPFELTGAQKRVIREIRRDTASGLQMNRLLQGDVGSGKTLVALMVMLLAIDNGFQSCLMAPTEILANQHYHTLEKMLDGLDINIMLLTGSSRKKEREKILNELKTGRLNILIGTHALLEDPVVFANLGMVVIDEQHRFGVAQRAKLWKKNVQPPHVLVMTATPIPRTLAMTLYGDLDVSVIDELPPGRKPIQTFHYSESRRLAMYGFLRKQIDMGQQVYVVYPLIKESEKLDLKDLQMGFDHIAQIFPPPHYNAVCVHGKMKPAEKEASMQVFKAGKAHLLVATTVIEVGVDVPNATVMVIENAERFGLSQLHQLRGRVGRGGEQSYCILMSSYKVTNEARKRLEAMVNTNDGFEIAEADLKLRGPGDIEGTQQSGVPFDLKMANLAKDGQLLQYVRNVAEQILDEDPDLNTDKNRVLREQLAKIKNTHTDWSDIS